jgi:hypothetical protein
VGVYRLWRDLGYVVGALTADGVADAAGMSAAINVIGALTIMSGIVVAIRLYERRETPRALADAATTQSDVKRR